MSTSSDYAVLVRLKVPADARGVVPIRAEAHWLACTDKICVPEQGSLSLDLPVGSGHAQPGAIRRLAAGAAAAAGERRAFRESPATSCASPSRCRRASRSASPICFPITDGAVDYDAQANVPPRRRHADRRTPAQGAVARAVLGRARARRRARACSSTPCRGRFRKAVADRRARLEGAAWAVLGAIAGGILLNLMPCVFPILALKALHLSRAGGERARRALDALAYAAGAIVGTGALGAVAARHPGRRGEAGWAFQLQDPRTIMLLLLLAVAITANLLGLFELPVLGGAAAAGGELRDRRAGGVRRDAVRRAVPRRGARHGAAAAARGAVAVFAALGLGLALPFVVAGVRSGAAGRDCRSPARGWRACSASSRSRWRRARSPRCGCSTARPGDRRLVRRRRRGRRLWRFCFCGGRTAAARRRRGLGAVGARRRRAASPRSRCVPAARAIRIRRSPEPNRGASATARVTSPGQARVRLFHRRLVPQLQGQRSRPRSTAARFATRSARPASRCSPATGPTATRRSPASSKAAAAPACRFTCGTLPASRPEELPQVLTPGDAYRPRSGPLRR